MIITKKNRINLPDLSEYKVSFQKKGLSLPLPKLEFKRDGLLKYLPKVDKMGWPWATETDPAIFNYKKNWPKITIVTPSYNQGQFIEETIRAVLLQNYPNLEYIVMDGGSTDNTVEILEKYSPWISYWKSKKDDGQGNAINQGFSLASGEYYAWINSDDYYLKNVFHKVINKFLATKTDFIYGDAFNFDTKKNRFELIRPILFSDYFIRIPTLAQPSCFWSKKIHQPIWEELSCSLDYELWIRMLKGQKRRRIKVPLSVATIHGAAKTYDPKMKLAWRNDHELICNEDAHGKVRNWNQMIFLNKIYITLYRYFLL